MKNDLAIKIEGLGKKYRIGTIRQAYGTFRDLFTDTVGRLTQGKSTKPVNPDEYIWALKDINFEVKKGEVVGVIGRNGAGKSTLLKVISRITSPTEGRIILNGRVGTLLEVGTGFHPELTGRENIFLNGAILGMTRKEIKSRFDEIVAFAEVEKFLDTPVKLYSSGMYVRLAFAVAAHMETEILLVDEVLAVGDAAFQKKCLGKMKDVSTKGRTVIFVSHNMPLIESLCHKVILLNNGQIETQDETKVVVKKYLSQGVSSGVFEVDLANHSYRTKSIEPAIKKIWITGKNGVPAKDITIGGLIRVAFSFECSRPIFNPGFGFGFDDTHGRRIITMNNYIYNNNDNQYSSIQSGVAFCEIPRIQLLPNKYFISISFVENDQLIIDYIERALAIEVKEGDFFGSGKLPYGVFAQEGKIIVQLKN